MKTLCCTRFLLEAKNRANTPKWKGDPVIAAIVSSNRSRVLS